jgi:hypothetical protein
MIISHLDLAKEWDRRGNRRMVIAICNSFKRLERMRRALLLQTERPDRTHS